MHTIKISFITTWYGDWNIIKETKKKKRWDASTVGRLTAVSLRLICRRCVTMWYTTKLRSYGREYIQGNLEIRVNISRSLHTKNWNYARLKTIFHSCLTCASEYFIARLGVKSESNKVRRIPRIDLEFIFFLENCAQILKTQKDLIESSRENNHLPTKRHTPRVSLPVFPNHPVYSSWKAITVWIFIRCITFDNGHGTRHTGKSISVTEVNI